MTSWRFDGADISHYQLDKGPIDWARLRAGGSPQGWFACKATQGKTSLDPTFKTNRAAAATQGFRHRGLYHWLSPTSEASIAEQVAWFLKAVGTLAPGEFWMLDAEQAGISEQNAFDWAITVEAAVGRPGAVYSGVGVAGGAIWRSQRIRALGGPMHLAAYGYTPETLAAKLKALGVGDLPVHANQYSSNGPVPGVTGRCDMNQINDLAIYDTVCGLSADPQPLPEDDMARNYYVVTGANAKFIGTPDRVAWTGPGDAKKEAAIATQLAAGNLVQVDLTGGPNAFAATFLDGPLPTGDTLHTWTGDEFANAADIKQAAGACVDLAARDAAEKAAQQVGKLDQELGLLKDDLAAAGHRT